MNIKIEIDCEDEAQVLWLLSDIRKRIKKEMYLQAGDMVKPYKFNEHNCYGEHSIEITPES